MKYKTIIQLCIFALSFTMYTTSVSAQKDVSAEIINANENFMNHFNGGDAENLVALYTEDARVLPPNSPVVTGMDNLKNMWGGMIETGIKVELKTVSADGFGKTAVEEGTYTIFAGDDVVDVGKYIVIWKKEKGTWKLHQDIFNSDNPLPGN
jgi:ketosteroid isomerase-like protein